jgi:hypothetical protein
MKERKGRMILIRESDPYDPAEIKITLNPHSSLEDTLDAIDRFLKASTFSYEGKIGIVEEDL